jgi:hypothetical protein
MSHTVSLKDYLVTAVKEPKRQKASSPVQEKQLPQKNAPSRDTIPIPLEKALAEAMKDIQVYDPPHGKFSDIEIKISKEVRDVFSKCQENDESAIAELKKMLSIEDHYSALHGMIAAGLVGRLMPDRKFTASMVTGTSLGNVPEFKAIYSNALASIGDPQAIPALFNWLIDEPILNPNDMKGEIAPTVQALETLSGKSFGPERGPWEIWWFSRNNPKSK